MRRIVLESPYAPRDGRTVEDHVRYARLAMVDCLRRGEAPFPSHLLYTQPGVLDDGVPEERELGILAGFAWAEVHGVARVFYVDLGWSKGMREAWDDGKGNSQQLEIRHLPRSLWDRYVKG